MAQRLVCSGLAVEGGDLAVSRYAVGCEQVEELRRHKVKLVEARERAALAPDADRQADRVSALREELLGRQRQLRSLLPRPSEGDSVLVCSANAVGTVEAAGGKGADYRIILPSGISSLLPEGDELDAASTPQSQGD